MLGNQNGFHSPHSDFQIRKGNRIYEEDDRHSKHEAGKNTEILNKPGVYGQEASSGDGTEI